MNEATKVLNFNPVNRAIVRGSVISKEIASKGTAVTWRRLEKEVKEDSAMLHTSRDYVEYAVARPAVDVRAVGEWLAENASLQNVQDWLVDVFDQVNRRIVQSAATEGKGEANLIGDIESLVYFQTMESARGRKASRLHGDHWKLLSPVLGAYVGRYYVDIKGYDDDKAKRIASRMLDFMKAALSTSAPMTDSTILGAMHEILKYAMEPITASHPEMESLVAFGLGVVESHMANVIDADMF